MNDLALIKGIGTSTITKLNKLDIYNSDDLITYYPYRYDILKKTNLFSDKVVVVGIIESIPTVNYFNRKNRLSFRINIDNKIVNTIIFNRAFLKQHLTIGKAVTVIGKYDSNKNVLTASDIKLEDIGDITKVFPIYHLIKGITSKNLNKYINLALKQSYVIDYLPEEIILKNDLLNKKEALNIIHNPVSSDKLKKAIYRCKYEELFLFMLKINELKNKNNLMNIGYSKNIDLNRIKEFIETLPFKLTPDQEKTLDEIFDDLKSDKRMNRLVQGDVGSGKTIVAIISMYVMYLNGYQSTMMAPTEILAHQHFENMKKLFSNFDINICEILGSTSKKEKEIIKQDLESGKIDMIVGTHALIQDDIKFNNLGLIITDEQHRFGVNQRANLRNKGNMPDVLYLSATPIPRTYALTIYGDMDISIIKTRPEGRKPIITKVKNNSEIKGVLLKMKEELDNNHQIYIVSPLIENEESDDEDIKKLYRKFSLAFKDRNIGILHGKMSQKEKDEVMNKFLNKEIDILISTTVIEVGVDVKNATMMIIFDAYKFGLSTLHQLRGRVGRNDLQSYCVLMTDRETERLNIMENVSDGFVLAEEDFKLRGSGDLFGTKQSGDMNFKLANLTKDFDILLKTKEDSNMILSKISEYPLLKGLLYDSINKD
ncbi:MAG: ATP-dependent DNA helicase RecG [Bacilli bacterium]|nr:ATP-dependent DNA helicase RecG [Bacilli bacterium]